MHAIQLEMCWSCYMQETPPFAYMPERALEVQPVLRELLGTIASWRPRG
jgi:N-formylglutamate deformylase